MVFRTGLFNRGGGGTGRKGQPAENQRSPSPLASHSSSARISKRDRNDRVALWRTCFIVVLLWITTGTLFYAKFNRWPLATAFFYAVDAGMSIGFCTDVRELTVRSKAFTIFFILAGASVIGGALSLLVTDLLEGATRSMTYEFRQILETDAFRKHDQDNDGRLTYTELASVFHDSGYLFNEAEIIQLATTMDRNHDGYISELEFHGAFRKAERFLNGLNPSVKKWGIANFWNFTVEDGIYTMYTVFASWLIMGVVWGMLNQKWDIVTSTHFAVSALATGGLTAPPATDEGILPADVAIFVGLYALLGIPLFYLALGHSAKLLVQSRLAVIEKRIIETPLKPSEFFLAKSLCSRDEVVHMSDFIVLQFLRRGLTSIEMVNLMKREFERMDQNKDGVLSLQEATSQRTEENETRG